MQDAVGVVALSGVGVRPTADVCSPSQRAGATGASSALGSVELCQKRLEALRRRCSGPHAPAVSFGRLGTAASTVEVARPLLPAVFPVGDAILT